MDDTEVAVPWYEITFLKTVCSDRGREQEICQRRLEVESDDEFGAIQSAKNLFCSQENILDWSLRADAYRVQLTDRSHSPPPGKRRQRVA